MARTGEYVAIDLDETRARRTQRRLKRTGRWR
jgi:16S rRNA C967 or C1407 C5-methylase (RsmB/RsmF family)